MTPIATDNAPAAIGAYSQAITHAGVVYCSGQIGLTPEGVWRGPMCAPPRLRSATSTRY